jgi:integrase
VPLRMVMEILGHSQISTTLDIYTHVMPAGGEAGDDQADEDDGG